MPGPGEPPAEYRTRDADWFEPGRLFKIWAAGDVEIHDKEFLLLDTRNIEGPGLRVRVYSTDEEQKANKGYFLREHVLVNNHDPNTSVQHRSDSQTKRKCVYLDEFADATVETGTWIEIGHTYNIPFVKYKCTDNGILDRSSLHQLRRYYVDYLRHRWDIE